MRSKLYVGIAPGCAREVFRAANEPTQEAYGAKYAAVIGPFRTARGARFMAEHGGNNPHLQCVADAERAAFREVAK